MGICRLWAGTRGSIGLTTALLLLLIVSWFLPEIIADFVIDIVCMTILIGLAVRIGYVVACFRLGRRLCRESIRSTRFRNMMSNAVGVFFFIIAVLFYYGAI